VPQIAR